MGSLAKLELLENNHCTPAYISEKNCGLIPTQISKSQVGNLDFHTHQAVKKTPNHTFPAPGVVSLKAEWGARL